MGFSRDDSIPMNLPHEGGVNIHNYMHKLTISPQNHNWVGLNGRKPLPPSNLSDLVFSARPHVF